MGAWDNDPDIRDYDGCTGENWHCDAGGHSKGATTASPESPEEVLILIAVGDDHVSLKAFSLVEDVHFLG